MNAIQDVVRIEHVRPEHWDAYRSLRLQAVAEEPVVFSERDWILSLSPEEVRELLGDAYVSSLDKSRTIMLWARKDKLSLGAITVEIYTFKGQEVAYIYDMYIVREYRGQGLGKKLLLYCLAYIKTVPGVKVIRLSVPNTQEAALALYISVGFRIVASDEACAQYIDRDGAQIELLYMEYTL